MVTGQLYWLGPDIRSEIFGAEKPRSAALRAKLKIKCLGHIIVTKESIQ